MNIFFDKKNTVYGGLRTLEAVSSLPCMVGLSGGDQIMPQGIIRNSLETCLQPSERSTGLKGRITGY